jgi:hypothetical protein
LKLGAVNQDSSFVIQLTPVVLLWRCHFLEVGMFILMVV